MIFCDNFKYNADARPSSSDLRKPISVQDANNYFTCYSDQAEARRMKVKEARKRREERILQKKQELLQSYQDEAVAAKK